MLSVSTIIKKNDPAKMVNFNSFIELITENYVSSISTESV